MQLIEIINEEGESTKYSYTKTGLLSSVTDTKGNTIKYSYDKDGKLHLWKMKKEI